MTVLSIAVAMAVLAADYVPEPAPCPSELNVGCFYFPGHFNPLRWRPFREIGWPTPVLGFYRDGEPEVSDWHIKWAVEHGIDFFAFDWYCHYKHGPSLDHNLALDEGFLKARYRDRMKFCLMWCNEGKEERYTEDDMLRLAGILTERYFSQSNHLRIDGDNVLIVSIPNHLLNSFGVEGTARLFQQMAQVSIDAGHGGLFPVAKRQSNTERLKQAGFRAITAYNYPTAGMTDEQRVANCAPYAQMVKGYEATWQSVTKDSHLPYIVPVSPGWDSRPWYGDKALVRTNPQPHLFYEMCTAARSYVDSDLQMVLAECWNEFGEGSYIEPTLRYGFGYLDAMRDAFCDAEPDHVDITPAGIGRPVPVFSEIPALSEAMLTTDGNVLFNPDFEGDWGWIHYNGAPPILDDNGHTEHCLVVTPERGVKSQWLMPVPGGQRARVALWCAVPDGVSLAVKAALFRGARWLGRYSEIATLESTSGQWERTEHEIDLLDAEATAFNIEFNAAGGRCRVDDIEVRLFLAAQ